jgi:hypothetical protein
MSFCLFILSFDPSSTKAYFFFPLTPAQLLVDGLLFAALSLLNVFFAAPLFYLAPFPPLYMEIYWLKREKGRGWERSQNIQPL